MAKVTPIDPKPAERKFNIEVTETQLRYIYALVGETTGADDERLGCPRQQAGELYGALDDAVENL